MTASPVTAQLSDIASRLPESSTWEDALHVVWERTRIQRGFDDIEAGRVVDHEDIRGEFGFTDLYIEPLPVRTADVRETLLDALAKFPAEADWNEVELALYERIATTREIVGASQAD